MQALPPALPLPPTWFPIGIQCVRGCAVDVDVRRPRQPHPAAQPPLCKQLRAAAWRGAPAGAAASAAGWPAPTRRAPAGRGCACTNPALQCMAERRVRSKPAVCLVKPWHLLWTATSGNPRCTYAVQPCLPAAAKAASSRRPHKALCTSEADGWVGKVAAWVVDGIGDERRHKVLPGIVASQLPQHARHVAPPQRLAWRGRGGRFILKGPEVAAQRSRGEGCRQEPGQGKTMACLQARAGRAGRGAAGGAHPTPALLRISVVARTAKLTKSALNRAGGCVPREPLTGLRRLSTHRCVLAPLLCT